MIKDKEIRRRFLNSLKLGTGGAYLLQKDHPKVDFSKEIIKGAIENFAYDPQCEGTRADYVNSFIKKSQNKRKIQDAILLKLQEEKNDWYGLDQMCDLAVLFHKDGNSKAHSTLKMRLEKSGRDGYEFCGQNQLIKLEGLDGLLKVAEIVGRSLLEDEDDYEDSYRVDTFQKKNRNINVYDELEKAGKQNKFIEAYFKSVSQNRWRLPRSRKIKKFSYELIKEKIEADNFRFISTERANELSESEVLKLAEDFLNEKDKHRQALYLNFYGNRKFPFDYKPILNLACDKNPPHTNLVGAAVEALTFFEGEDIRYLAIQKITKLRNPSTYLPLLVKNYKAGDFKLLNEVTCRSSNYNFIHSIVFGLIDIYGANPTTECKQPLEVIYSKMNCGLHRFDILNILHENGVLSDSILKEMQFDSYSEIRRLHREIKKSTQKIK